MAEYPHETLNPRVSAARARSQGSPQSEIRIRLGAAFVVVALIMAFPVLTSFTSVLNGSVGGIGVAYLVGAGEYVFAMVAAAAYCRWAGHRPVERSSASPGDL